MRVSARRSAPFPIVLACLALAAVAGAPAAAKPGKCQGTKQERKQKLPPRSLSDAQLATLLADYGKLVAADREAIRLAVLRRFEREYEQHAATGAPFVYDILILSGGGAKGAFGAGFLDGWGSVAAGPHARPEFDAVTGVSTGALIAPFAFIGTDEAYRTIADLYANPEPTWAKKRGMIPFLPHHESLLNNCRLRDAVFAAASPKVVEAIGAGAAADRLLLIGATNLDAGSGRAFSLGPEVVGKPPELAREAIVSRLMASSAIPGVFTPILIDGMLYADGGATTNLFVVTFPGPEGPLALFKARHPEGPQPTIRLWVVVNQKLRPRQETTQPKWIDVSTQSLNTLTSTSQEFALNLVRNAAERARANRGVDVQVRLVSIPEGGPEPTSKAMFDKAYMISLQQLGRAMGADPSSWQTELPEAFDGQGGAGE